MARINWWTFKCATCGHTDRRPNHPTTLQCDYCGESMRSSGNGGGGIGSVHAAQRASLNYEISGSNVTAPAQPIGWVMAMACGIARGVGDDAVTFECGFCKSTHHYAKAPSSYECRVCGGWPDAAAGSGNDGAVDGLDRYTCWVRWHQNRNSIEGGRGYAIHPLTDAQIVAAKLVQSQDWNRERMMNPPKTSKPKLTILVDQDIED